MGGLSVEALPSAKDYMVNFQFGCQTSETGEGEVERQRKGEGGGTRGKEGEGEGDVGLERERD